MKQFQKYISILVCTLVVLTLGACENYLGGDTNKDPNRIFEDDIGLDALLPPVLVSTSEAHFDVAFTFSQYAQHISFVGETDSHDESQIAGAWIEVYLSSLNNLDVMEQKAKEVNASHYLGIVKVMQAYNLSLATTTWEDIPWSDTFKEGEFSPSYDSQEEIYSAINTLLNEGIAELQKAPSEFLEPGSDDIIYGGNIDQWIKTAYALKARTAIHLTEQGAVTAADNALAAVSNAYSSNADDFQVTYNNEKNLNPWHTSAFLAAQTGNPAPVHSDQLIDMMNGETYPEEDPRLPVIADNGGAAEYYGSENGNFGVNADAPDNSSNAAFTGETFHSRAGAPIVMMTYAEMKFIEAEAAFLKANGGNALATGANPQAYNAYMAGIEANMDKLGVSTSEKDAYMNASTVDVGVGNLTMELIMKEKFKALFLNPEVYTDYRRYDFNDQIFRDLELPADHNEALNGEWIQRAVYPSSELSRNQEEVKKAQKDIGTPMWFYN